MCNSISLQMVYRFSLEKAEQFLFETAQFLNKGCTSENKIKQRRAAAQSVIDLHVKEFGLFGTAMGNLYHQESTYGPTNLVPVEDFFE